MFDFSVFRHDYKKSAFPHEVPQSKDYKVFVNGAEIPVYACRISAYPFNTWWPGYQRPVAQSEIEKSSHYICAKQSYSVRILRLAALAQDDSPLVYSFTMANRARLHLIFNHPLGCLLLSIGSRQNIK